MGRSIGNDVLSLLALPLDDALLGSAHVYEFGYDTDEAWQNLRDRYRDRSGSRANLPYAGLATALRAAGRTSVNFHPVSKQAPPRRLVARAPLHPEDLREAVIIWEQALLGVPPEDIRLGYTSELADLIADIEPRPVRLFDEIGLRGNQPDAAGWVYTAATWEAAQRLAGSPLHVDDRSIALRADTNGDLTVWEEDQLWRGHWPKKPEEQHYACLRIALSMQTLPGMKTPVLLIDPAVSRLSRWLASSRTAWLSQHDPSAPLLPISLEGRGRATRIERTSELALTVWSRLRLEPAVLPEDRDLSGTPGRLRAIIPKSVRSPIGRGAGMETVRALSVWSSQALGTGPITARSVPGHQFGPRRTLDSAGRDTALLASADLPAIIEASGKRRLRIVALYQRQHTRARMQRLLAHHFHRPEAAEPIEDGTPFPLAPHVEGVLQGAFRLLEHGDHRERRHLAGEIAALRADPDTRVLALCETAYDAEQWAEQHKRSREKGSGVADPYTTDAKPEVNRRLAELGVPSQFLATRTPAEPVQAEDGAAPAERLAAEVKDDHPGHRAIADLMRSAGLIHHRLGAALSRGRIGMTDPVAHVGLHVREQHDPAKGPANRRLSWTLAALIPLGDDRWRALAYQPPGRDGGGGWKDYAQTNASLRAHPIPAGRRQDAAFPRAVETALAQFHQHTTGGAGYALYVSGESTRSLWPLLANRNLDEPVNGAGETGGRIALPGLGLPPVQRPRAIVRVTSGSSGLPRPVSAVKTTVKDGEHTTTLIKTTKGLYRLDDADRTWILSNIPKQFLGSKAGSRVGEKYSRWSARPKEVKLTWYAHTATEITVIRSEDDPLRYAVAAARLCDHAISWDGRTSFPAPVHLAMQLDRDHPDYRRTTDSSEGTEEA
ncbi:RNaseH domain-containing protein [Nocardiopsis potens]|uniref:RNaseH domain-containing protein n=1 Tax=Nocardiopsis potens TaxID=1246458 RepID=UPI00034D0605|nr:RNaseH domain-containing protein [Nocardiopsis potens]